MLVGIVDTTKEATSTVQRSVIECELITCCYFGRIRVLKLFVFGPLAIYLEYALHITGSIS